MKKGGEGLGGHQSTIKTLQVPPKSNEKNRNGAVRGKHPRSAGGQATVVSATARKW